MARVPRSLPAALITLVLGARPVEAQDRIVFRATLASAVVAHAADLAETQRCLGSGRCRELNPWLLRFDNPTGFAVAKMSLATATLWATTAVYDRCESARCRWLAIGANVGQSVAFFALAAHNARQSR